MIMLSLTVAAAGALALISLIACVGSLIVDQQMPHVGFFLLLPVCMAVTVFGAMALSRLSREQMKR